MERAQSRNFVKTSNFGRCLRAAHFETGAALQAGQKLNQDFLKGQFRYLIFDSIFSSMVRDKTLIRTCCFFKSWKKFVIAIIFQDSKLLYLNVFSISQFLPVLKTIFIHILNKIKLVLRQRHLDGTQTISRKQKETRGRFFKILLFNNSETKNNLHPKLLGNNLLIIEYNICQSQTYISYWAYVVAYTKCVRLLPQCFLFRNLVKLIVMTTEIFPEVYFACSTQFYLEFHMRKQNFTTCEEKC